MSSGRGKGADQTTATTKGRAGRGPLSVSTQVSISGSPPSFVRAAFSGGALWVCLSLIAANVIVYAPVWHYDFVNFDDPQYVYENPIVSGGLTWRGVSWALTTGHDGNWFPLTWLSHMLDVQVYGLKAGGHHLTNVMLHIAATLLLFGLLHGMTGALGPSAFVAGLFAVHPLQMESVAWVAERKNVLCTLFWMLTLWGYVGYVRQPRRGRYLVVLLLFTLGLMAKPMLVTLPFALLLLDVWPLGRVALDTGPPDPLRSAPAQDQRSIGLRLVWEKLPLFALAIASSIVTLVVQQRAVITLNALPLNRRLANAVVSYVSYIGEMLWPTRLGVFYNYPGSLPGSRVAGAILILFAVSVAVILAARRHPYLPVGWLWYLGTLVPVIGLVQVGNQAMADRYAYVPLIGLFIMTGWGVPDLLTGWRRRSIALPVAAGVVIAACTITARDQVQYWKNSVALWEHTLKVSTENHIAETNLGDAFAAQGRVDEAIAHYAAALRIAPGGAQLHYNLGNVLASRGRFDEAISHYAAALRIKPNYVEAHNNLANALVNQGRISEAIAQYSEALRLKPDAHVHYNVAVMLEKQGRLAEAVQHLAAALKLDPSFQEARSALGDLTRQSPRSGPGNQ